MLLALVENVQRCVGCVVFDGSAAGMRGIFEQFENVADDEVTFGDCATFMVLSSLVGKRLRTSRPGDCVHGYGMKLCLRRS
jgi:hypothetical protein